MQTYASARQVFSDSGGRGAAKVCDAMLQCCPLDQVAGAAVHGLRPPPAHRRDTAPPDERKAAMVLASRDHRPHPGQTRREERLTARKELILMTAEDAGRDFAFADRKSDSELSRDDLDAALASGEVNFEEITSAFLQGMRKEGLGS